MVFIARKKPIIQSLKVPYMILLMGNEGRFIKNVNNGELID